MTTHKPCGHVLAVERAGKVDNKVFSIFGRGRGPYLQRLSKGGISSMQEIVLGYDCYPCSLIFQSR